MSAATDQILEQLKTLSLLEAAELVKQIEEAFGVSAAAPVGGMMMAAAPGAAAEVVEEKTTFDVVLEDIEGDKRVAVLKVIRSLTSLGLKEAKEFTTSLPKAIKESVSKEEAENLVRDA